MGANGTQWGCASLTHGAYGISFYDYDKGFWFELGDDDVLCYRLKKYVGVQLWIIRAQRVCGL